MLYDITRPLSPRTAVFPGDTPVSITPVMSTRNGDCCNVSAITMSAHAGTHIDAPRHYADDAPGVDALDLGVLTGPARVVTIHASERIAVEDVAGLDDLSGVALLVHTRGSDTPHDAFDPQLVHFAADAAAWLGEQGVRLVGIDTPSVDAAESSDLPAHRAFQKHGVVIVENLWLRDAPDGLYRLFALPLKIVDGDAAPARCILLGP